MESLLAEYWDSILLIVGNLLVILRMLSTLKTNVKKTGEETVEVFNKLKEDFTQLKDKGEVQDKVLNVLLRYVEDEADIKQLNKIIPEDVKEEYRLLKEEALKLHDELTKG